MKLRLRGSSIRLRLSASEVEALARDGRIEEAASFAGGGRLRYALEIDPSLTAVTARFDGGLVTVALPREAAAAWTTSDQVGIAAEQATGADGSMSILVEKDGPCGPHR